MALLDWVREYETQLAWLGAASLLVFVGSLIAIPLIVMGMAEDFFLRPEKGFPRRPLRQFLHVGKNLAGYLLIFAGLLMLILPGQGLLTVAIGLGLIDFPGKRRLEIRLVRLRTVHASIAWIRRATGRPPLRIPARDAGEFSGEAFRKSVD